MERKAKYQDQFVCTWSYERVYKEASVKYVSPKFSTHAFFKCASLNCCELRSNISVTI